MRFASLVFRTAAIYGLLVLLPQYALEARHGRDDPPAITHPEFYYGFVGIAVAWQLAFLLIARDPARLRPLMLVAVVEKLAFGLPAVVLYLTGRLHWQMLGAGLIDLLLGTLFLVAYLRTGAAGTQREPRPGGRAA